MQRIFKNFTFNPKEDILSGLTVALALVPEAVAFAFVAGVPPIVGLYGAFMMGLVTAMFGGRPGMISAATGAMAVVMVHMIQQGNEVGMGLADPVEMLGLHVDKELRDALGESQPVNRRFLVTQNRVDPLLSTR